MQQFHILSFEGPDAYSRAGGIGTRIAGLFEALVDAEIETHLWFVGEPDAPGYVMDGFGHLHRWCQWISRHHPCGVYDGEDGKAKDYARSLAPCLVEEWMGPQLMAGGRAVVLAEEWHTVDAVLHLDWLLRRLGLRDRVVLLWNANNTFGFHRIDWSRLSKAAIITTVSRYMKQIMSAAGVDALVIPNGLDKEVLARPDPEAVRTFRREHGDRVLLAKMARFDRDKRWMFAVKCVDLLKRRGLKPLLVARGGTEPYGAEVMDAARGLGLKVVERTLDGAGAEGLVRALRGCEDVEVLHLRSHLDCDARRVLFRAADAVLANSSHEPFGLVGLEAMAAGGLACTGCSGEDYAVPGRNALVLQTEDPNEFVALYRPLRASFGAARAVRRAGRATARDFAWPRVVSGNLLPRVRLAGAV